MEEKKDNGELDEGISFTHKLSWSDRVIEKKLGFIKHHLMDHFQKGVKDVKINWRRRDIEMGNKKVAAYENDSWSFHKSAKIVEPKVNESMAKWLSERDSAAPPSESD